MSGRGDGAILNSLFERIARRADATLTPFLDRLFDAHGYPFLSRLHDLSAYVYAAAAVLVLLVLLRRRTFGWFAPPIVIAAVLAAGACYWLRDGIEDRIGTVRLDVLYAMRQRPADPWPRGTSHAVLGRFGSAELEKAYLEPGGSFSPSPRSFGVSFWVVDRSGALVATSDDIPLDRTRATYETSASGEPAIRVETPYYVAIWTAKDDASFELAFDASMARDTSVQIVFRGVGPAAGPLTKIDLAGEAIDINDDWSVGSVSRQQLIYLGDENSIEWKRVRTDAAVASVRSTAGWAVARLAAGSAPAVLKFRPRKAQSPAPLPHLSWPVTLDAPDPRFAASFQAQVMALGLGLVGQEARPGEPLNYPLEWLRDGAYIAVALARAGQHELASRLALAAAPKDFFGGFGAEGDAPGLGIWMLAETAAIVRNPAFDRAIWPHVERKVALIRRMLQPGQSFVSDFTGPIVPKYRRRFDLRTAADPPRDGLIDGRMDLHRPLFFVNAATYAGLTDAARVAERLGEADLAKDWRRIAADLRQSWNRALLDPAFVAERDNERTAIAGLWPSSVADRSSFETLMNRRWESQEAPWRDPAYVPQWTYFLIAEAHQWNRLDRPDRVWTILDYFWSQQRFPDLYVLWEGTGEENSFGGWRPIRGWVTPPHIVPHYWSAAEMLLLQLGMLAEVRADGATEELVIGAGVPPQWLSRNLSFKGIGTSVGAIDWTWNGTDVVVTLPASSSLPVRLGKSFPASARIEIK